jgi:hypothetical protein
VAEQKLNISSPRLQIYATRMQGGSCSQLGVRVAELAEPTQEVHQRFYSFFVF